MPAPQTSAQERTDAPGTSGGLKTRVEAAAYLSASLRWVDEELRAGRLAAVRIGRNIRIPQAELDRYIAELPAYEPAS